MNLGFYCRQRISWQQYGARDQYESSLKDIYEKLKFRHSRDGSAQTELHFILVKTSNDGFAYCTKVLFIHHSVTFKTSVNATESVSTYISVWVKHFLSQNVRTDPDPCCYFFPPRPHEALANARSRVSSAMPCLCWPGSTTHWLSRARLKVN